MNSLASRIARHQASRRCFSSSTRSSKEKLVILGSGWGGYRVLQDIDKRRYDVSLISPTGVFSFTPLLAGASVGTLELRCTTENVRRYSKQINFAEAWADNVDFRKKQITCMPSTEPPTGMSAETFRKPFVIDYDKLVISVGAYAQTFGVPGVKEHATFLKTVADARRIRNRIIECFEQASQPHLTDAQRAGLLHFAVVGGGPTGIEWSAELHDLITADMKNYYPKIHHLASITVYEVSDKILGGFDGKLQEYARERFQREGINVRSNHHVEKVEAGKLFVKEIGEVPCGLIVWSTGLALNPLVDSMQGVAKTKKALLTDGNLRVLDDKEQPMRDVWAIGDCAMVKDGAPLPATAQAANQKAMYVSKSLNMMAKGRGATAEAFEFKSKGSLAYIGDWKALMDNSQSGHENVSGSAAFVLWRSAYTITTLSLRNKITVPFYWFMNWAFGRDIARF